MSEEVKIISIEDHEDGSATLQVECDPEIFVELSNSILNIPALAVISPVVKFKMAISDVGFVTLVKAGEVKGFYQDG